MQAFVQTSLRTHYSNTGILAAGGTDFAYDVVETELPLTLRRLRTPEQRMAIAGLRKLAAFGVEQDLGLGLAALEHVRDEVGVVMAVYREGRAIATLRLVPTGHQLTGAERLSRNVEFDTEFLGAGSWEVGRVIMAPEERHPDLLLQCLSLAMTDFMRTQDVRHFHATTTLPMARLWRRVGMRTTLTTTGESGTRYALVHGRVLDVAAALNVGDTHADSMPVASRPARAHAEAALA